MDTSSEAPAVPGAKQVAGSPALVEQDEERKIEGTQECEPVIAVRGGWGGRDGQCWNPAGRVLIYILNEYPCS